MAVDLSPYKVATSELSSSTKFDNLVQAVQDALNALPPSQLVGYPGNAAKYLRGDGAWAGDYAAYTPVWGGGPTLGNGALTGRYVQIGKLVHVYVQLVSGSTTTFAGTAWTFSLPVPAAAAMNSLMGIGTASILDVSPFTLYAAIVRLNSATEVQLDTAQTPTQQVQQTIPFTFAVNDAIRFSFTYEAA